MHDTLRIVTVFRCTHDGIIAGQRADDFFEAEVIERRCDRVRHTGHGADHQQVSRCIHTHQRLAQYTDILISVRLLLRLEQLVVLYATRSRDLAELELLDITGNGRLRHLIAFLVQDIRQLLLRRDTCMLHEIDDFLVSGFLHL